MAKVVVRCQYTGNYVFTGIDTARTTITGGQIFCPYCVSDHVWSCQDARLEQRSQPGTMVRQAG